MNLGDDADAMDAGEVDAIDLESVDRFLDSQRRLLDDLFDDVEPEADLSIAPSATIEDEPDELDA